MATAAAVAAAARDILRCRNSAIYTTFRHEMFQATYQIGNTHTGMAKMLVCFYVSLTARF